MQKYLKTIFRNFNSNIYIVMPISLKYTGIFPNNISPLSKKLYSKYYQCKYFYNSNMPTLIFSMDNQYVNNVGISLIVQIVNPYTGIIGRHYHRYN